MPLVLSTFLIFTRPFQLESYTMGDSGWQWQNYGVDNNVRDTVTIDQVPVAKMQVDLITVD